MISDKTKRHIQIEENKILEKTGLHINIDKLTDIAQEFEMFNGEIPHRDVSTIFKAASGGFTEDITGMRNELQHFKKSKIDQKNQITDIVQDLITNPKRIYKNEGKSDQKDKRRFDSSSAQRNARQNSFDRARDIPKDTQTTPTHVTYRRPKAHQGLHRYKGEKRDLLLGLHLHTLLQNQHKIAKASHLLIDNDKMKTEITVVPKVPKIQQKPKWLKIRRFYHPTEVEICDSKSHN